MPKDLSTNFAFAMKTLWPQNRIVYEGTHEHPWLAMIPRKANWKGDFAKIIVAHTNPQGRSADFSVAFANRNIDGAGAAFAVSHVKDYHYFGVDNATIEAAQDEGAVLDALNTSMKTSMEQISSSAAHALWRDGTGTVATIATGGITGDVITLANPEDIIHFQIGMVIRGVNAGAYRTGSTSIIALNYGDATTNTASTITVTAGGVTAANLAALDGIVISGDLNAKLSGVPAWIVGSTVTTTPFFGVNRVVNTEPLAGIRIGTVQGMIKDTLQIMLHRAGRGKGRPGLIFLHGYDYQNLILELGTQVQNTTKAATIEGVGIGFDGVEVAGPGWKAQVFADYDVPVGQVWALEEKSWKLAHRGPSFIRMNEKDGDKMSRLDGSADAIFGNWFYYAQAWCENPGHNVGAVLGAA